MRSVDTYVTTMLFRVVSKRFDGEPQLQARAHSNPTSPAKAAACAHLCMRSLRLPLTPPERRQRISYRVTVLACRTQERAALGMGAVLVFGTSIATLVAFELVREHVIACRLPDEVARLGNAGAPSSSRALHLADFSRQDPLVPG